MAETPDSISPLAATVELRASVSPSEDPVKVLAAMRQVFGDCDYAIESSDKSVRLFSSSTSCLQKLHDQLRDRHVRDAARRLMLRLLEGDTLRLMLNRQAASAGVLALCTSATESPLGPLNLSVRSDDPQKLIDWLTSY